MQTAPHTSHASDRRERETTHPTIGEMLWEVLDLGAGLGIVLLPLLAIALPGVVLLLLLPAVVLLILAAVLVVIAGAIVAPPYLLVRLLRRRVGTRGRTRRRSASRREPSAPTQATRRDAAALS